MPVPTHFRFTFRGIFAGTPETWSFGMHFTRDNPLATDAQLSDINQGAVTSALVTFLQGGWGISNLVHTEDWRAYIIGTNGRMEGNPLLVDLSTDTTARGNSANRYPPQIALCTTLVAANRGPGRFGRFFLPGPTAPLGADMRLTAADANGYLEAVVAFVKDVSDAIDLASTDQAALLNVSPSGGAGAGTIQEVDHIEMGRVYDTLRSRRRSMVEDRIVGGHIDW